MLGMKVEFAEAGQVVGEVLEQAVDFPLQSRERPGVGN
jgi:hypothetical protein